MAVVCEEEMILIEHIHEDNEGIDMPKTGEQDNGAYGLEVCVVDAMNANHNDVDDDEALALAGDIMDIELGEGKEYHLFFCHSSHDLAWVWDVVKILEAAPYNLKCAFSERDFLPGQNDMNEMFRCITGSMRTVFVLTPAFTDSRWCEWEMQMAQTASVANNISLLPIMLQECPVPDTIKHINYIDVTHKDFQQAALKLQKNVEKPGQGFIPMNIVLRINGSSFPVREKIIQERCCKKKLQFELPPNGTDALEQKGITAPKEEIEKILEKLTLEEASIKLSRSTLKWKICHILSTFILIIWFLFSMMIAIPSIIALSANQDPNPNMTLCSKSNHRTYTRKECNINYIATVVLIILLGCMPLILQILLFILRIKKIKKVTKLIMDLSLNTMTDHKMYIWCAKTDQYLRIVKYDINSCWHHMIQQLDPNIELFDIEAWKLKITEKHFPIYIEHLMQGTLEQAHIVLHPTINNQVCFCQYIQAKTK
ncbi:unnamed protein product [Owenia fusiformis]|uniref:Uncharacterized protein n=1 Tax=Owenia fusiformis TaxID=6347 RepID=A0A8J1UFP1_OWEFU|nr:unnamed protein product [Owenia fusiformis]